MTYDTDTRYIVTAYNPRRSSPKALPQNIFGSLVLACIALACARVLYVNVAGPGIEAVAAAPQAEAAASANTTIALLDPAYSLGFPAGTFKGVAPKGDRLPIAAQPQVATAKGDRLPVAVAVAQPQAAPQPPPEVAALPLPEVPLPEIRQVAQIVPLPAPRPPGIHVSPGPSRQEVAQANKAAVLAVATPDKPPTIFEKLFGKLKPYGPSLAYAAPDGGIFGDGQSLTPGRYDRSTAVYDISAHTVYMPDGTKLEAHSGLGPMLDDPRHADQRMRGVTPPHTYDLTLRESLFHGVRALRLTPVGGEGSIYGRSGLLAHTYMLGPNGDSNGCVSFRNYEAFLRAYMNQEVKRLVVVARL